MRADGHARRAAALLLTSVLLLATAGRNGSQATLVGTWMQLDPIAANPADGIPGARADHSFELLSGRSLRANAKVPFPTPDGTTPPSVDPYANQAFVYSGHTQTSLTDSWLLDLGQSPPVWTKLPYTGVDSTRLSWSVPIAFLPNGLHPDDSGLTAVLCSGYDGLNYVKSVRSFNFASRVWRQLQALDARDPSKPFPRAYTEWKALPKGYGTGTIDSSIDSGDFYLLSGAGAADGVTRGPLDKDWPDAWIAELTTGLWHQSGMFECESNTTACTDAQTIVSYLAQLASLNGTQPVPDLEQSVRPSELRSTVSQVVDGWNALSPTESFRDDPATCVEVCSSYKVVDGTLAPRGVDGGRGVIVDGVWYWYGGYACVTDGNQQQGGDDCFPGDLWRLDLATMRWSVLLRPNATDTLPHAAQNWPSRRAYHTMVAQQEDGLILIFGGSYTDAANVFYYLNDVTCFDVRLQEFVPIKVSGTMPNVRWSHGAIMHGRDMLIHGGSAGSLIYGDLFAFKLGFAIGVANCFASGFGLSTAVAGELASFEIVTREAANGTDADAADSPILAYGTGLEFTAQLVELSTQPDVALVQVLAEELGLGRYRLSYTATIGTQYKLYVYLENVQIPSSPFTVQLQPQPTASASRSGVISAGLSPTAKGENAMAIVTIRDGFGNSFQNSTCYRQDARHHGLFVDPTGRFPTLNLTAKIHTLTASESAGVDPTRVDYQLRACNFSNLGNGSFVLTYQVPEDASTYLLLILLNGLPLADSPFTITALDPIRLPRATVVTFLLLASINIAVCLCAILVVYWHRARSVIRASSPTFLYLLIVGSGMASLSVVFLVLEGHDFACQAYHSLLSTSIVVMMASLVAKAYRVSKIFNARVLKVSTRLSDSFLMVPTGAAVLVILLLNLIWIGVDPVRSESQPSSSYPTVLTFQSCASRHGTAFVSAILTYIGLILLYSLYLAVQTNHVPDQFNESKVIAAAVYNISVCAAICIPLMYFIGSSSDFYNGRVVIQAIVILWCSGFNVVALIAPKAVLLFHESYSRQAPPNPTHIESANLVSGTPTLPPPLASVSPVSGVELTLADAKKQHLVATSLAQQVAPGRPLTPNAQISSFMLQPRLRQPKASQNSSVETTPPPTPIYHTHDAPTAAAADTVQRPPGEPSIILQVDPPTTVGASGVTPAVDRAPSFPSAASSGGSFFLRLHGASSDGTFLLHEFVSNISDGSARSGSPGQFESFQSLTGGHDSLTPPTPRALSSSLGNQRPEGQAHGDPHHPQRAHQSPAHDGAAPRVPIASSPSDGSSGHGVTLVVFPSPGGRAGQSKRVMRIHHHHPPAEPTPTPAS